MTDIHSAEIAIPYLGMNTDTVPRLLPETKAPLIKNFLFDRPGVLPMRGPICEGLTWNNGAAIGLLGVWAYNDKLLISRYAASSTKTRDYWVAPYRRASATTQLRDPNPTMQYIDLAAGTVSTINAAGGQLGLVNGLRGIRVGNFIYGVGAGSTTSPVSQDGSFFPSTGLIRWDGSSSSPISYGSAPGVIQDIALHYQRLFCLGGVPNASFATPIEFNSLFWSDPLPTDGTGLSTAASAWQDDVSGLTNRIVVGGDNPNDFGVALAHVGSNLCVLKRRSIWMINGTSPSNFVVKQANNDVGCIDPRSVVEYNEGVYFMSDRGYMYFDGVTVTNVSEGLSSSLVTNAIAQVGSQGVDGGYCRATLLGMGYIMVTTGFVLGSTLNAAADADAWLFHVPTRAWQQLSTAALATIIAGGRSTNHTWIMDNTKLIKANYVLQPNNAPVGTAGFDSVDSGTTKFTIPSRLVTRALSLAGPPAMSKLIRALVDYYWTLDNSVTRSGWFTSVNARSELGIFNIGQTLPAPSQYGGSLPTRGSIDVNTETDETFLDITATAPTPGVTARAELHRIMVQYSPIFRSRTTQ